MGPGNAIPDGSALLLDATRMALAVLDAQGVVTGWTRAAERLTGYPDKEIVNRPAATLLDRPGDQRQLVGMVEQCRGVVIVRHRDGRRLRLVLRIFPLLSPTGTKGWVVLARDEQAPSAELSRMMLEPLLTYSPVGLAVLDTDLRYVWVNDVLTYDGTLPREQRLGRRVGEVLPDSDHVKEVEKQLRQVLETGVPVLNFEYLGASPAGPPRQRAWWNCFFRLEDSAGQVLGVWYMAVDNTESWQSRQRLALLNEASVRIGSTLDVARTAQELADVAVGRLADAATVDLLQAVLQGEEPSEPVGDAPVLRRVAQQLSHDACPETTEDIGDVLQRPPASPSACCLGDGETWMESLADLSASAWLAEDPTRAVTVRTLGVHSVLVVPVQARGVRLGIATFLRSRCCPDPFDQDDVKLAEDLVARAAVCLDNARRFTRERKATLALQHSLLPRGLVPGSMLDVASRYLPANAPHAVGGDWFDVIPLSGARVALVVGDVVGQGAHAAATMGRLRAAVRTLADMDLPPDELLAHLDDLVISMVEQEGAEASAENEQQSVVTSMLGTTCLYAVYDPVSRRCTLARAGHLPPAIATADGMVAFPDLPAGPPLGLGLLPFESVELDVPDGAVLALFTNGLVEDRVRDVDVGLANLARALARPAPGLDEMCENIIGALLTSPPRDDAALLLARAHGLHAGLVASWDVARDPAVVASAREFATRRLAAWGLEELAFTTELLVSELVTNAIRYGAEPIHLRLIRSEALVCEVFDSSSTSPRLRHARTTDEGGRGLFLVAQVARRWGTRYTSTGKIIWAEQAVPSSPGHPGSVPEST
ncbi:SpoIIE family protein phosphatase [Streptomyces rapamycinicus]|uniref:SpoIIE family protein phosphatase n=1 Tax=Streptomyces rhizosphaericus TaxID=114699 RepID=A0A6G4AXK2_9ACTN|nr:SpoIIE family protein phosphatase [Streptomyces rhizosphaericus]